MKRILIIFLFIIVCACGCVSSRYTDDGKMHFFKKTKYYDQRGELQLYTVETKESIRHYDANGCLIQVIPKNNR
jgi:uncharacterized protein YxeA